MLRYYLSWYWIRSAPFSEVMPFYGTLDRIFILMNSISDKANRIWRKRKSEFCRTVKRKMINISFASFLQLIEDCNQRSLLFLSLFEVLEITIKSVEDYSSLFAKIKKCSICELIKIRSLKPALSSKDDFNWTYEKACHPIKYYESYREFDLKYNSLIKTLDRLNLNISRIDSFLYLDEFKNRYVGYLGRLIVVISDDMDLNSFKEKINMVNIKNIEINWFSFIFDINSKLNIANQVSPYSVIFEELYCKRIEFFVNSEFQSNIIAWDYLGICDLKANWKVIHLKRSDLILKFQQYF